MFSCIRAAECYRGAWVEPACLPFPGADSGGAHRGLQLPACDHWQHHWGSRPSSSHCCRPVQGEMALGWGRFWMGGWLSLGTPQGLVMVVVCVCIYEVAMERAFLSMFKVLSFPSGVILASHQIKDQSDGMISILAWALAPLLKIKP